MASISAAAFSFIVQDPSGIIVRSSARSLSDNRRRYLIIAVSVRYFVNASCCRNSLVRPNSFGMDRGPSPGDPSAAIPNAANTLATCASVVASSQEIDT